MNNLKNRIQTLMDKTNSPEVREACKKLLESGNEINESAIQHLLQFEAQDDKVKELYESYTNALTDAHRLISKNAAARLASWNPSGTSTAGGFTNEIAKKEVAAAKAADKLIVESLSNVDDEATKKEVSLAKAASYGVSEAIQLLRKSPVSKHQQMKYMLDRFDHMSQTMSESLFVRDFVSSLSSFKWDNSVREVVESIEHVINSRQYDIEVQNSIEAIRSSDRQGFFDKLVESMTSWLASENHTPQELGAVLKPYLFNPIAKQLANKIMMMENAAGTTFNVPIKNSNCSVSKIFSPVHFSGDAEVFFARGGFFKADSNGVSALSEKEVALLPKKYMDLLDSFKQVRVNENGITAFINNNKIEISEEKKVKINEQEVGTTNLGMLLAELNRGTIFSKDMTMVNHVLNVFENIDNICEVDYGKTITSNLFEGVGVDVFKRAGSLFVRKTNPAMKEDSLFKMNGVQAVKTIKEFLSYDLSEAVVEFLRSDNEHIAKIKHRIDELLEKISAVEAQLSKIESVVNEDESIGEMPEIMAAKETLENALTSFQKEWRTEVSNLKKFEDFDSDLIDAEKDETTPSVEIEIIGDVELNTAGEFDDEKSDEDDEKSDDEKSDEDDEKSDDEKSDDEKSDDDDEKSDDEKSDDDDQKSDDKKSDDEKPDDDDEKSDDEKSDDDESKDSANESIKTGSVVRIKNSNISGKVTAIDTIEHRYTVLLDDGSTMDYSQDELENMDEVIKDAIEKNETKESEPVEEAKEEAPEEAKPQDFVIGKVVIDIGPYKQGDSVEVDAVGYTSSGAEDPISIKDPIDPEFTSISKKYITIEDAPISSEVKTPETTEIPETTEAPKAAETAEIADEEVVKSLDNIETLLKTANNINKPSAEKILQKIKNIIDLMGSSQA
jgi:hypothetical protein